MPSRHRRNKRTKDVADRITSARDLVRAVRDENVEEVRRLVVKEGVPVNVTDADDVSHASPLLIACEHQNHDIVHILLNAEQPAKINIEDARGIRPIWYAAKYGDEILADLLLDETEEKCDVNFIEKQSGCSPLYRSVLSDCAPVCRALLHAGADVNLRRLGLTGDAASAETPLIKSVQLDNAEICEMLLNSLCDINARTEEGFTALHHAVSFRRYNITEILLHNRIKINAKSHNGVTAMTLAIDHHLPKMCQLLIEYGYDMNRKFDWNETPLEMAIRSHSDACAKTLINWGCSINRLHVSYFRLSIQEGLLDLSKMLIEVNPLFLNEYWIRTRKIDLAIYQKPDFCQWLFETAANPRTLTHWCRVKIRQYLGKYPCSKYKKLPLPAKLLQTFEMNDFVPDKMYKQESIYTNECPYDCWSLCERIQCPPIDFSDSGSDYSGEDDD